MAQPTDFIDSHYPNHVYKLDKSLYGSKQFPRAWYTKLSTSLLNWGFVGSHSNTFMFTYTSLTAFLFASSMLMTYSSQVLASLSLTNLFNICTINLHLNI